MSQTEQLQENLSEITSDFAKNSDVINKGVDYTGCDVIDCTTPTGSDIIDIEGDYAIDSNVIYFHDIIEDRSCEVNLDLFPFPNPGPIFSSLHERTKCLSKCLSKRFLSV